MIATSATQASHFAKDIKSKSYCFTLWLHNQNVLSESNFKEECKRIFEDLSPDCKFFVFQLERCPKSRRLHLQCFIRFKRARRGAGLHKLFGVPSASIWFTGSRGSDEDNRKYCTKPDSRVQEGCTLGVLEPKGKRSDLIQAAEVAQVQGLRAVAQQFPATFIRYHSGLYQYTLFTQPADVSYCPRRVICLYGPTRTGKTRFAYEQYGRCWKISTKCRETLLSIF